MSNPDRLQDIANNSINIGNNIAGGDIHYTIIQTRVCPTCEEKLLNEGMEICQHCKDKEAELMGKRVLSIAFLIFMVLSGWLLQPDNFFTKNLQGVDKLEVACLSAISIMIVSAVIFCIVAAWLKRINNNRG